MKSVAAEGPSVASRAHTEAEPPGTIPDRRVIDSLVGDREQHVGVARLVERAVAREVVTTQLSFDGRQRCSETPRPCDLSSPTRQTSTRGPRWLACGGVPPVARPPSHGVRDGSGQPGVHPAEPQSGGGFGGGDERRSRTVRSTPRTGHPPVRRTTRPGVVRPTGTTQLRAVPHVLRHLKPLHHSGAPSDMNTQSCRVHAEWPAPRGTQRAHRSPRGTHVPTRHIGTSECPKGRRSRNGLATSVARTRVR